VHVTPKGTLILNDTQIVSGGIYKEADPMDLPVRLAQLYKSGVQIIFSVGAGGSQDFANIGKLLNGGVPGKGNALFDNFTASKEATKIMSYPSLGNAWHRLQRVSSKSLLNSFILR